MSFGQRWSKIKITVLLGMNGGSDVTSALLMGLNNGSTNTFNSASSDGFWGIAPVAYTIAPTWTYAAGPPKTYSHTTGLKVVVTKVGASVTATNAGANPQSYWADASNDGLSMYVITINREESTTLPNWSVLTGITALPGNAALTTEVNSDFKFYQNLEAFHNTGSVPPYGCSSSPATTGAWAWTTPLDTFCFIWGSSTTIDIAHIGVLRME
jgi:hypothetical protein